MQENLFSQFLKPRNFYIATTIGFIVWIGFFDRNDLYTQYKMYQQQQQLKSEKKYYHTEIQKIKKQRKLLTGDAQTLERYAREKFRMKRKGEDVYVITKK